MTEQERYENMVDEIIDLKNEIKYLQAENERLKEEIELLHSDYTYKFVKAKAKAEAYKECIEKILNQIKNNNAISAEWLREYLNNILKEMVGEDNAKFNFI